MSLSTLRADAFRSVDSDSTVRLATFSLNQHVLAFDENKDRIIRALKMAKASGAKLGITSELSLCGYSCADHFLEPETEKNCFLSLAEILRRAPEEFPDIVFLVGMPMCFMRVRYNVDVICLNNQILLIRPKINLANDLAYYEERWFTKWDTSRGILKFVLPKELQFAGQIHAPFGEAILRFGRIDVGVTKCEELFCDSPSHIPLVLFGCHILLNSSGSHHSLRKLEERADLIKGAMSKSGGVYIYSNQRGCDGARLYFDGCASVNVNGEFLSMTPPFGIKDLEMGIVSVDIDEVDSMRAAMSSSSSQASLAKPLDVISIDFSLKADREHQRPSAPISIPKFLVEEEIGLGPACYLWDYLRRSGAGGFVLPLSGGADSASTATIIGIMCHLVVEEVLKGDEYVLADVRRITKNPSLVLTSPKELAKLILHTCYMGTANSSDTTRRRAFDIAEQIGSFHKEAPIDAMVNSALHVYASFVSDGTMPRFSSAGGSVSENLALQNIQARMRMVLAYQLAQLLPGLRQATEGTGNGFLLVLGSSNLDESLRGYMTKYDCSSADINPIGGISKADLKKFLLHAADAYNYPALKGIVLAIPTAELVPMASSKPEFGMSEKWTCSKNLAILDQPLPPAPPLVEDFSGGGSVEHSQSDEVEMGMSYGELSWYGRLRKIQRCGPFDMYKALLNADGIWKQHTPAMIAEKVKRFFFFYGINRHKSTTLTPSYQAEKYGSDDNRYDQRPFLYSGWAMSFRRIDEHVRSLLPPPSGEQ